VQHSSNMCTIYRSGECMARVAQRQASRCTASSRFQKETHHSRTCSIQQKAVTYGECWLATGMHVLCPHLLIKAAADEWRT
jgi:hypothetical protein